MGYFFRRARRHTAGIRWGVLLTTLALLGYAVLTGRGNQNSPTLLYSMTPVITIFLLVFAFALELFRTAHLVYDEPMAHLIPVPERSGLTAIALSLILSGALYAAAGAVIMYVLVSTMGGTFNIATLWTQALNALRSASGIALLFWGLQLVHFVSLVLLVQTARRRLDQRSGHSTLPEIVLRVLDLFISVIFWVLSYAVALFLQQRIPVVLDVNAFALAPMEMGASVMVNPLNWSMLSFDAAPVGVFVSLPIFLFLFVMTCLHFAGALSLVEDHIDW
ncbi:MAG: hypothetical protein PUJ57_06065 [Peptoniphilaceae bacterium]|nr:hypothetical protein [Peptoniphilaceae bacterium]MDY6085748.1 hypothetical protein [Peptoniphilaceae bacterium]